MQDVAGHREQIGLRRTDGLMMLDPHQPQEHFLRQIRCVRSVAQPAREKRAQPLAEPAGDRRDEILFQILGQMMTLINVPILEPIRAVAEEKWIRPRSFIIDALPKELWRLKWGAGIFRSAVSTHKRLIYLVFW